jgi:alcohol dehydrogenase class IV
MLYIMSYFNTTPKVIFGKESLKKFMKFSISEETNYITIFLDRNIASETHVSTFISFLKENFRTSVYTDIEPDPSIATANKAAEFIRNTKPDLIIGIGGGSVLDIAKAAAALATYSGDCAELLREQRMIDRKIPLVLIPTTAGTGSEATPIVILSDTDEHLKKGLVSDTLIPDMAILAPELTLSCPQHVTAHSGMDALIHAVEAYTSGKSNAMSDFYAREACRLIGNALPKVYQEPQDLKLREKMLLGSYFAGVAFANASVTAVHAFAYPIGAEFHIPHGLANSIMFEAVMKRNYEALPERFNEIAGIIASRTISSREEFLKVIRNIKESVNIKETLSDFGVKETNVPHLAKQAMKVTRLLEPNPVHISEEMAREIYRESL